MIDRGTGSCSATTAACASEERRRWLSSIGVFLDVDGTLVNLQDRPQAVRAPRLLIDLLRDLAAALGGAVALISGRRIEDLDRVFEPLQLPAAGLHGLQRRDAMGSYQGDRGSGSGALAIARQAMRRLCEGHPGLALEDKGASLALHFRRAPQLERYATGETGAIAAAAGAEFELLGGKGMVELRPTGVSKGTAVGEFLNERPFLGRAPVYVGDDLTDEPAFERINRAGGLSIAVDVQRPTAAMLHLPSPAAVRHWLQELCTSPAAALGGNLSGGSHVR